jgi:hypothetical protein
MGRGLVDLALCVAAAACTGAAAGGQSVARQWNEQLLGAIRIDFARPTVHARNLYHVSVAMWDAWAAYDPDADGVIHRENATAKDIQVAREEAISYAAYRVLKARFANSPGGPQSLASFDALMNALGYDINNEGTVGGSPAAVGNRVAMSVLFHGLNDNANEAGGYANLYYEPVNEPLIVELAGNPTMLYPNRWQPLSLDFFIDQAGNPVPYGYPEALSPEWGQVIPFALKPADLTVYTRDGFDYWVYHDPGLQPQHGGVGDALYKWGHEMVAVWQSHLDPADGVLWDISPGSLGNTGLPGPGDYEDYYDYYGGGDWGTGYELNPVTGEPYEPQIVPRGDLTRVLAEFWADGPDSETPPGHWFVVANYVADHPLFERRLGGKGPVLDPLEWDVKVYLALGGAMHDTAVAVWGIKGWYDSSRPVSAIRYMADRGQCTDPQAASFDPSGIDLQPGYIELITPQTTRPGERHAHLAGNEGKIALYTWRGHEFFYADPPHDPRTEVAGVGWILAELFMPYQRPTFVTPPFPGYTSGHTTYSRTAAEVLTRLTGSEYFPGGLGEFHAPQNEFLVFEDGPSVDLALQWASYFDAATQSALSRIWGGIHPPFDDLPTRAIASVIGPDAFCEASRYYNGQVTCPSDVDGDGTVGPADLETLLDAWGSDECNADVDRDGGVGILDLLDLLRSWGGCP